MKRVLLGGLVVSALASSGCAMLTEVGVRLRMNNHAAPDFELTALDGEKVRLSDFRGKPVLLAFWAYG